MLSFIFISSPSFFVVNFSIILFCVIVKSFLRYFARFIPESDVVILIYHMFKIQKYIQNLRLKDTKKSDIILLGQKSGNFNEGDWV